ncbi:MAG TPA: hypothetical protein VNE40_03700 [Candidatus Dormibacteraeota bacterium]|nr:hypothetical protein [Candidatus Dormibacteraeota bacterium]
MKYRNLVAMIDPKGKTPEQVAQEGWAAVKKYEKAEVKAKAKLRSQKKD